MAKVQPNNLAFAPGAKIGFERGTGTDASQAVTIHKPMGRITSSTTNLGADTSQTITLTNRHIKADSVVLCQVAGGGSGVPVISKVTPAAGSCAIIVRNVHPSQACTAAYTIDFVVVRNAATM